MNNKKINKLLNEYNKGKEFKTDIESFIRFAKRYINATKNNRLIATHESNTGMTHYIKIIEVDKKTGYLYNFNVMFEILGFNFFKNTDKLRISGGNMDMLFATHYNIISDLFNLGFITKKTKSKLLQSTPNRV